MRILLIKTSSLGDVIHNLPVVADIRDHFPDAQIDWVVEEHFAAIPRMHPHVARILPVALRRWRKQMTDRATRREWRAFKENLQEHAYDFVIDTQGLLKSAALVRHARGLRCGFDRRSAREPLASFVYQRKFFVEKNLHAVERNRQLVAKALAYKVGGEPSYGIDVWSAAPNKDLQAPYVVLLHATSRADKLWREENWRAVGEHFAARGLICVLPSGNVAEFERAARLAKHIANARAIAPQPLEQTAALVARAQSVIGVDTGLTHLACAFGKPTVAIYCNTAPGLTGVYGSARALNLGGIGLAPSIDAVLQACAKVSVA